MLCWVLVGPSGVAAVSVQQGRSERVGTAFIMGVFVLLAGFGMVLGWLGVSWVVM